MHVQSAAVMPEKTSNTGITAPPDDLAMWVSSDRGGGADRAAVKYF